MDNYNFIPPFFLFLAWRPSWLEVGITGHNFERGPSKDHSTKVWLQLAQWFLRRRLKCEMLTDGRRTKSDDNSSLGLKGELKMAQRERGRNQALCYGKCWSKLLLTKQIFFSQSCDIKSEFSYIICYIYEGCSFKIRWNARGHLKLRSIYRTVYMPTASAGFTYRLNRLKPRASKFRGFPAKMYIF